MQPLYQKEKTMLFFSVVLLSLPIVIMLMQSLISFVTAQGLYMNILLPAQFFFIIFIAVLLQFLVAMTIKFKTKEVIIIDLLIGGLYFLILIIPIINSENTAFLGVIMMIILIIYNVSILYAIRLNILLFKHLLNKG